VLPLLQLASPKHSTQQAALQYGVGRAGVLDEAAAPKIVRLSGRAVELVCLLLFVYFVDVFRERRWRSAMGWLNACAQRRVVPVRSRD
jgi:hypothetical protein